MNEEVEVASGSDLDFVGNEARAVLLERGHCRVDVIDVKCDVMEAGAALLEKAADCGVFLQRLQQLDTAVAKRNDRRPYLLVPDGFFVSNAETQRFVKCSCRRDAFDGDPEMIDFRQRLPPLDWNICATSEGMSRYGSSAPEAMRSAWV